MFALISLMLAAHVATASSIHATVRGTNDPVDVALMRLSGNAWREVALRHLPPSQRDAEFENLDAGVYEVRLRGPNPLEQAAAKVNVGAHDRRSVSVEVDPIDVFGRVTLGDIPLGYAVITLKHGQSQWQGDMQADERGLFHARLWQRGAFRFYVRSAALATTYGDGVRIDGVPPFRWELRLPDRRVAGVVRDRATGAPVPGAKLYIATTSGENTRNVTATADSKGRFDLAAMLPGVVTITAVAEGHINTESAPLTLLQSDRAREMAIDMEPGTPVPLTVTDAEGRAQAGATILTVSGSDVRARASTDSNGFARVTLPRQMDDVRLYVVPRGGSFATVRVADAGSAPRRIAVPRASSTLRIVTRTTAGAPLPDLQLLMRFNGEMIPPAVADELETLQGLMLQTDEHGEALLRNLPSGAYEFWPYTGEREAEAIVETASTMLAPIVVNVRMGDNSIAVNFRAR